MTKNDAFDTPADVTPDAPARAGAPEETSPGVSRRGLVRLVGGGLVTAGLAGCSPAAEPLPGPPPRTRQAGVTTAQQAAVVVTALDLHGTPTAHAVRAVLARWGRAVEEAAERAGAAARLTATVGIGPALPARLGIRAPERLRELPSFTGDRLDPARSGGDVVVQVCAEDAATAAAATAALTRLAHGTLRPRWHQSGYVRPVPAGQTPRNLLGFKDGTANPTPEECERWVWTADDATFLVVRRIRVDVTDFRELSRSRQEEVIGRRRADGAPFGGAREHDEANIFAKTPQGRYVLPLGSHVRAASPRLDGGARMLRRGYSYDDGPADRGLLFLAFMRDPHLFVRVQQRMAERDELSRFSEHRGSAVAYVLPGARPDRPLGSTLL